MGSATPNELLLWFTQQMERRLKDFNPVNVNSTQLHLYDILMQAVNELFETSDYLDPDYTTEAAADVANIAMMIAHMVKEIDGTE